MNTRFPRGHNARIESNKYYLHGHNIVSWNTADRFVALDHCGYMTATTKVHMNDVLHKFLRIPWGVYQKDFEWYAWNYNTGEEIQWPDNGPVVIYY